MAAVRVAALYDVHGNVRAQFKPMERWTA